MAVAFAMAVTAQEKKAPDYGDFTVKAQVRAYGDYRGGMLSDEKTKYELFVTDRARLSFGWERKNVSLKLSAHHIGFWHDDYRSSASGKVALHEAWARVAFGKGFFTQVGRQELSYDDERLFGTHDWVSSGRAHDALRLGWENEWNKVHAIVSFNQTAEVTDDITGFSTSRLYKHMQTVWYHYGASNSPFQISGIAINQGVNDAKNDSLHFMQTLGVYMTYAKRNIFSDFSLYGQMGRDRSDNKVRAFRLSGNFGWQFLPKWRVTVGDDYLSGSDGMPGTNRTFNLLYGSYHDFLGAMDNFDYHTIPSYGLNDAYAKIDYKCSPKFNMNFSFHWFMTGRRINDYLKDPVEHITDPEKILLMRKYNGKHRFSQNLGSEVDLQVSYSPWKFVNVQAGFSMMFASETMQFIKDTTDNLQKWGWIGLNINPTIFSTKH